VRRVRAPVVNTFNQAFDFVVSPQVEGGRPSPTIRMTPVV
jgi:hypothetical protein